jgi:hypothetical protein
VTHPLLVYIEAPMPHFNKTVLILDRPLGRTDKKGEVKNMRYVAVGHGQGKLRKCGHFEEALSQGHVD